MPNKPRIVVSLGGSILIPGPKNEDASYIDQRTFSSLTLLLNELTCTGHRFVITVGGGKINSHYVETLKQMSGVTPFSNRSLDLLGISATKFNATLLWVPLDRAGLAYGRVVENPTRRIRTKKPVIVGCGWKPGCSTDMDAVLWAINVGAKVVINASNIHYVYDRDPNKFHDAQPIETMSWDKLLTITGRKWIPRMNAPFDPIAAQLAQKHGLRVFVLDGRDIPNLRAAITGEKFIGTTIG